MRMYSAGRNRIMNLLIAILSIVGGWLLEPSVECMVSLWLSFATYEAVFNREWAWGIILILCVHEIGHMLAAHMVRMRTTLPIFIPFLGAVVALSEAVRQGRAESAVALGGPALGGAVAGVMLAIYCWSGEEWYLFWAYLGAQFNLFNLVPCYPLDGGRIAEGISRYAWWGGILLMLVGVWLWRQPLLLLFVLVALYRYKSLVPDRQLSPYHRAWITGCYLLLCILLGAITMMIEGVIIN